MSLENEERKLIKNRLGIDPELVPDIAVVNYIVRVSRFALIEDRLDDVMELKASPFLTPFEKGFLGRIGKCQVLVFTGRIRHELLLVPLFKTRVKVVYAFGLAGALQQDLSIGDIVIPVAAVRGEGLTRYYAPAKLPAVGDLQVLSSLALAASDIGIDFRVGTFYTTSSWCTEPKYIEKWAKFGVIGIERELARHYLLASLHRKKAGGLYVISDSPIKGEKIWVDENMPSECYESMDKCVDVLVESIRCLNEAIT